MSSQTMTGGGWGTRVCLPKISLFNIRIILNWKTGESADTGDTPKNKELYVARKLTLKRKIPISEDNSLSVPGEMDDAKS